MADSVYGLAGLHTGWNWHDGNPFDLGWILFYSCWGAAALHPSMRELSEPRPLAPPRTSRRRLALLGAVSLIAPVVLLGREPGRQPGRRRRGRRRGRGHVPAGGLAHGRRWSAPTSRPMTREQVLRREAAELVGAPGRSEIHKATISAVSELVGSQAECLLRRPGDGGARSAGVLSVVAGSGSLRRRPGVRPGHSALGSEREPGRRARLIRYDAPPSRARPEQASHLFVCPLVTAEQLKGLIVVQQPGRAADRPDERARDAGRPGRAGPRP